MLAPRSPGRARLRPGVRGRLRVPGSCPAIGLLLSGLSGLSGIRTLLVLALALAPSPAQAQPAAPPPPAASSQAGTPAPLSNTASASSAAPAPTPAPAPRAIAVGVVSPGDRALDPPEVRARVGFDPAHSRGVFVGVNRYTAPSGVTPPNLQSCVNDAVDLAAAFLDLGLIEPSGIVLALSGAPSKPASVAAFDRLHKAGATLAPDARRDTIDGAVSAAATQAGPQGILFLVWAAHGFEVGAVQYLAPENFYSMTERPSTHEISSRAISEATLSSVALSSRAARRVLLFDACREIRGGMTPGLPQLIGAAAGMVTLYAVTSGEMALDGANNGAFTSRVLEALVSSDPPPSLRADRHGHVTIGTLLEFLEATGSRIEDAKILEMPLRRHPREFALAVDRVRALAHFRAAKGVELRLSSRDERPLDEIGIRAFEDALLTAAGPKLVEEADALLGDDASRSDFRKRRSFAAAWRDIQKALAEAAAVEAAAPPGSVPPGTASPGNAPPGNARLRPGDASAAVPGSPSMESIPSISSISPPAPPPPQPSQAGTPAPPSSPGKSETAAWEALGKLEALAKESPLDRRIAMYDSFTREWSGTAAANDAAKTLGGFKKEQEQQKAVEADKQVRLHPLLSQARQAIAAQQWQTAFKALADARELYPNDPALKTLTDSFPYATASTDGRFLVSSENVILDTKTNLEWLVGPDRDTDYDDAVKWVESCRVAGGGWRLPTRKELLELYQKGKGDRNMDPVFKQTGWYVWAEPRDSSSAWSVNFVYGNDYWNARGNSNFSRAFAVRSRR